MHYRGIEDLKDLSSRCRFGCEMGLVDLWSMSCGLPAITSKIVVTLKAIRSI